MIYVRMNSFRGFTIVETLVAIAIIMIVLITPFHTAEVALNAANISRDELTGDSLAQEGLEYVRSVRDGNYLYNVANPGSQVTFLAGLDGTASAPSVGNFDANCVTPNACTVDPINSIATTCSPTGNCANFPLDLGVLGGYGYPYIYNQAGASSGNLQTRFTRTVQLKSLITHTQVEVIVTVTWTTNGHPYSTTLTDYLTNYL